MRHDMHAVGSQPSAAGRGGAVCALDVAAARAENRGMAWLIGAFLICPCHLPLTFGLAATLLAGTALGAALRGHPVVAGTVISLAWLAGTWRGIHLLRTAGAHAVRVRASRTPAGQPERRGGSSTLAFFALTFVATWTCYLAAVAWSGRLPSGSALGAGVRTLVLLGTFMPSIVALGLTARAEGTAGLRTLLGRLFQWRVSARWYVFALTYMAVINLAAALAQRVATGAWPRFGHEPWVLLIAATVLSTVIGGQAGEEIGWRGYALPRMAARFGLGGASVVLGVIWAMWHLPLFFLRGAESYGQSFPVYLLQVTAISVAIAWLYWRTGGSLLLTMFMHAAINNTKDIVPFIPRPAASPLLPSAALTTVLGMVLLWIAATYFLIRMRKTSLTAPPAVTAARP